MSKFEYIKWRGNQSDKNDDFLLFYEVDLENERYATRMVEVHKDETVEPIIEEGFEFVTEGSVPTIAEINSESERHAEIITKEDFEKIYVSAQYI